MLRVSIVLTDRIHSQGKAHAGVNMSSTNSVWTLWERAGKDLHSEKPATERQTSARL